MALSIGSDTLKIWACSLVNSCGRAFVLEGALSHVTQPSFPGVLLAVGQEIIRLAVVQ